MTISLVAVDYSRPIQPMFEQAPRIGTIHSVFHKAMYIATSQPADGAAVALLASCLTSRVAAQQRWQDGQVPAQRRCRLPYNPCHVLDHTMLALLSDELPRMPNSMRLPSTEAEKLLPNLRTGMEVWVGNERLLIPALNFSLHLPETPAWEPRPDITAHHWRRETVAQHIRLLANYLAEQPQKGGLAPLIGPLLLGQPAPETPLSRMALPKLLMLALASWRQDIAGVEEATRGLAGLGPGLTPSGDDALGGFAAIMALLSPQISADAASRKHIAAIIAAVARPRTTALSSVLLAYAARGEVAEQLGTLLLSLTLPTQSSKAVLNAADCVLAFGANSGGDTLLGILLGLRALEGEIN